MTNYYSFLQAFNFSYLGFSSAITVVLLAATIVLSWVIVRLVGWGARCRLRAFAYARATAA